MSATQKNTRLIERLSEEINGPSNEHSKLYHKKTWLALVKHGVPPCKPRTLFEKLQELTRLDEYQPRGAKLLCLRSRDRFTLLPSLRPGRPEEALERLIVKSNFKTLYGQMPIRGRKESVDIASLKDRVGNFIELKPWRSADSPLWAILEGLKNLALFNVLKTKGHPRCDSFSQVSLMILAPLAYYREYHLVNEHGKVNTIPKVKKFIEALTTTFETDIQMKGLKWEEEELWKVCKTICPTPPRENVVVSVSGLKPIEALIEKNWVQII